MADQGVSKWDRQMLVLLLLSVLLIAIGFWLLR